VLAATFEIWYSLPRNPAITFLGIEINKERKLLRGPGYTEPLFKKIPE
jgi:hypothetical protein